MRLRFSASLLRGGIAAIATRLAFALFTIGSISGLGYTRARFLRVQDRVRGRENV